MEEIKELPFGKKVQLGNFTVLKYTKSLSKREMQNLRQDIPADIMKHLQRGSVPYIKVEAISGIWGIEFCCNTNFYRLLNQMAVSDDEKETTTLAHIFNMWFVDTTVPGDAEYQEENAKAFKAFMDRCKSANISDEDDAKILEELKTDEEAKATIAEMANELNKPEANTSGVVAKEGGDDGNQ